MQIAQVQASALSPAEVHAIAIDGFCYFYPLVLMDITRRQMTNLPPGKKPGYGPANSFSHMRAYPDANMRIVVRPNFDTLYSSAWLDLTEEPVVISVPGTAGRYYLLPMLDMWTDVFASPGWRTSGTGAQKLVVVPPGWSGSLPKKAKCIDAPTPYVWIIGRIQTNGPEDYDEVHKIQDAMSITPLSQLGKQSQDPTVKTDPTIDMNSEPLKIVQNMSAEEFFSYGVQLLELHAPHITDWSLLARLQRIGIECGTNFDFKTLAPDIAREFQRAVEDGLKLMREKTLSTGKLMNAWAMNLESMGVYGNNYLKRAIVALVGLGANLPEDAVYPLNVGDSKGQPLTGEKKYVLHFDKDQIPPVNAFWSITMYDAEGFQSANSINRFALSSWMPLKKNSDGSLDVYIQHESPGAERESNWLPAPANGRLGVTMRLYAPAPAVLNGDWAPPFINQVS